MTIDIQGKAIFKRRHYEAIASVLVDATIITYANNPIAQGVIKVITHALAAMFKADNPKFDQARFLKSAGA